MAAKKLMPKERLAFEKARFDYCAKVYEREKARKETLERKSDFYLSFVTLFMGAVFLKMDSLKTLGEVITQVATSPALRGLLYFSITITAISLLTALVAILESMRLRTFATEYPPAFTDALFAPDSTYLDEQDEPSLLRANAMGYAIALELNTEINQKKANWINVAARGVFAAVISLAALLAVAVYLLVFS